MTVVVSMAHCEWSFSALRLSNGKRQSFGSIRRLTYLWSSI